ncbi:SIR2 family protein [Peribacillus simplex]|uniref:SIR2 family protein n=2 Tax=Peribacillus TaxID=2675229 RepID=A0AA90T4P8_9BACI|nr:MULTISPECIES: SIR2 family protein [Peribacillus]MDP1421161.1 SIR2 family protein [Peribacillus simplex]MDP1453928.1 SIR2 family protein [Peribacillus frigoritolerans]
MNLEEAIKHALNGEGILFAGAGFSTGVKNQNGQAFKRANELCEVLCKELEIEFYNDLGYISQKFIREKGEDALISFLQKEFISLEALDLHKEIIKINWKRIYTTNYDDVIEKASDETGLSRIPITLGRDPKTCIDKSNLVIHLNGYIKDLVPVKLYSEFKLSRESYINDSFTDSKWATLFRHDIENARVIFFVGYSLNYDIDIQRILSTNEHIRKKCFFITKEDTNQISIDIMNDVGKVETIGIEGFSNKIKKITEEYIPLEFKDDSFYSFNHLNTNDISIEDIRDKNVIDLFIKGDVSFSHIFNYGNEKGKYLVNRTQVSRVLNDFENGMKLAIIHSNLGNGKTMFINNLISNLIKDGNQVFILNNKTETYISEVEKISKIKGNKYIFIENYNLHLEELRAFKLFDSKEMKFVVTARSFINDGFYLHLTNAMNLEDENVGIYEVNRLNQEELLSLICLLNEYHLWGEESTLNNNAKLRLLRTEYKGTFQSILLGLLKSKIMVEKVNQILRVIEDNNELEEIIFTSFINSIVKLNLQLDDIIYLLEQVKFSARITRDPDVNELIDVKQNKIIVKSSVLAQHVIKNTKNSSKVIDLLIKLMQSADSKDISGKYRPLMKLLVSFSNLRLIMSEEGVDFSNHIIKYYENIKNLQFNRRNPFFWFQYAIARLDLKQYAEAKIYFDNAYSYAREMDAFDTFQLNTHYARYLLESEIHYGKDSSSAFGNFIKAHELIYHNRNKPLSLHYPLRHAKYYLEIYNKFYSGFSEAEQSKFVYSCHQIIEKIEQYKEAMNRNERAIHSVVIESEQKIKTILHKIRNLNVINKTPSKTSKGIKS